MGDLFDLSVCRDLPNNLRNFSFVCDFTQGGHTVFLGACTAGYVGMLTGMRPGAFSISINARDRGGDPVVNMADMIAGAMQYVR